MYLAHVTLLPFNLEMKWVLDEMGIIHTMSAYITRKRSLTESHYCLVTILQHKGSMTWGSLLAIVLAGELKSRQVW